MTKLQRLFQVAINAYWEYKPSWTVRRFTMALNEVPIDRPIFLLGVQGGGLTLLARMIHRHERVVTIGGGRAYWVGNNEMDKQYIGELPEDFTLRSPRFRSPTFKTHMTGNELDHPTFGKTRCWVYACEDMVDRYRKTAADWTQGKEAKVRKAMKESIRAYASDTGEARFLDMSQTFALKIPLLRKIFPDARFIIQTRDPYAVCLKEARDTSYSWRRQTDLGTKLRIFAEHWTNTYRYATRDLQDTGPATFIRYEDLIARPEETLRQVLNLAELEYNDDLLPQPHHTLPPGSSEQHKWYPIRTEVNEKYLSQHSDETARLVERVAGDLAADFGYTAPEATASSASAASSSTE
jgi:hypothetical protein